MYHRGITDDQCIYEHIVTFTTTDDSSKPLIVVKLYNDPGISEEYVPVYEDKTMVKKTKEMPGTTPTEEERVAIAISSVASLSTSR